MKKYIKPEILDEVLELEDVIAASGDDKGEGFFGDTKAGDNSISVF